MKYFPTPSNSQLFRKSFTLNFHVLWKSLHFKWLQSSVQHLTEMTFIATNAVPQDKNWTSSEAIEIQAIKCHLSRRLKFPFRGKFFRNFLNWCSVVGVKAFNLCCVHFPNQKANVRRIFCCNPQGMSSASCR